VAGERCVPELCDGAGGVSDFGEPGRGWGDSWVWAWADAPDGSGMRDGDFAGAIGEDSDVCESSDARSTMRGVDDFANGSVAAGG